MQKLLTFFCKNISVYATFNDKNFNDTLTNDIVSLNNWAQNRAFTRTIHYGPHNGKRAVIAHANSKGSDKPEHQCSLTRTYAVCLRKQQVKDQLQTKN